MIILFYIISFGGLWFFIFRRRKFDFTSGAFIGSLIYFFPGFTGKVFNPYLIDQWPIEPISWETYAVWIAALIALIVSGNLDASPMPRKLNDIHTTRALDLSLILILAITFFLTVNYSGSAIYSADKDEVLANLDRSFIAFSTASQIAFVSFMIQRKYVLLTIPAISILFLIYIGFRAEAANVAVATAIFIARKYGIRKFASPLYGISLISAGASLMLYKFIYIAVKLGRFDLVTQSVEGQSFVTDAIFKSEPFTTQTILNEVLLRDYSVGAGSIGRSLLALVPLSNIVLGIPNDALGFSFQNQLFPNLPYGMASNIYAHFYAALGVAGILIWIFVFVFLIRWLNALFDKAEGIVSIVVLLAGSFLAFYINRNDLTYSITTITRFVYLGAGAWVLSRAIAPFVPEKTTHPISMAPGRSKLYRSKER